MVLIALIILVSTGFFLFPKLDNEITLSSKKDAFIFVNGTLRDRLDLAKNQKKEIVKGDMSVRIENEKMRVTSSNCPQRICVNTGPIETSGRFIVCVPNKVLIEIHGTNSLLDAVVE